jgi:hypothetical protein
VLGFGYQGTPDDEGDSTMIEIIGHAFNYRMTPESPSLA